MADHSTVSTLALEAISSIEMLHPIRKLPQLRFQASVNLGNSDIRCHNLMMKSRLFLIKNTNTFFMLCVKSVKLSVCGVNILNVSFMLVKMADSNARLHTPTDFQHTTTD